MCQMLWVHDLHIYFSLSLMACIMLILVMNIIICSRTDRVYVGGGNRYLHIICFSTSTLEVEGTVF